MQTKIMILVLTKCQIYFKCQHFLLDFLTENVTVYPVLIDAIDQTAAPQRTDLLVSFLTLYRFIYFHYSNRACEESKQIQLH